MFFADVMESIKKRVDSEERIAIVGLRGVGKSTLLSFISNQEWMNNAQLLHYPFYGDNVESKKIIIDDAHLAPRNLINKAIIYSSIVPLKDSAKIIYLRPLSTEKIKDLLDSYNLSYSKQVPKTIYQLTGGFLSYISILIGYVLFVNSRIFISKDFIIHLMSQNHIKRMLQRLAIDYLRDYETFIDPNLVNKLRAIIFSDECHDISHLIQLGLVIEKNGEYSIADPILASLIKEHKNTRIRHEKVFVKNPGFSKFYPLDDESFIVIHDKYVIAAIRRNATEYMPRIKKIAKIIYAKEIFVITPEELKSTNSLRVIKAPKTNFLTYAKRKIDEIISLIERINELSNIAHYY